jgi:hypothetical protein
VTVEYLSTGDSAGLRWRRPVVVVVVLLALMASGIVWWSGRVHQQANESLGQAITDADHEARAGEAVVLSMLQYSSPLIWSTMVGEDVRAELRKVVQRSAEEVVVTLRGTRRSIDGTFVLPWDGTQREAKEALLAVVDGQLRRFERIAADASSIGSVLARPGPSDAIAVRLLRASGAQVAETR